MYGTNMKEGGNLPLFTIKKIAYLPFQNKDHKMNPQKECPQCPDMNKIKTLSF
jgi:hypothetical protein